MKFSDLKANYPTTDKASLFKSMGSEWEKLIPEPSYDNTCAIRLSISLINSGISIKKEKQEALWNGRTIILKVRTMGEFIKEILGQSYWGMSKNPGSSFSLSNIPQKSGIVVYHADWSNASGHFDLWTGQSFVGAGNVDSIKDGYAIELWSIE